MPTLRIKLADQSEITHELAADRITIGRRPDNTIQIVDRSVSGHHAELIAEGSHYRLRDLGSTNLTCIDGAPVMDFHLHQECRINFGTVHCEYDPLGGSRQPGLSISQMEKDLAFLRGENADLLAQIVALQRQIDILSSARLVTKKADHTPFAAANDTLRNIVSERDDLRHLTSGLKLELDKLREELAGTVRERDDARQARDLIQAEKVTRSREMQEPRQQVSRGDVPSNGDTPRLAPEASAEDTVAVGTAPIASITQSVFATSPASASAHPNVTLAASPELAPDASETQKIPLPLPPAQQAVATPLKAVSSALRQLMVNMSDKSARLQLATQGGKLAQASSMLGSHPIARLGLAIEGLLQECLGHADGPAAAHVQTLLQATDLISNLLDPSQFERAKALPHPKVLAVDDDTDLLHSLAACLELAQLPTTTCSDGHQAQALLEKEDYDLLFLDVAMPDLSGIALCDRVRENERYYKTPVIFLTGENTLDRRAQTSLSGGNDFLPKPFNSAELTVKAETWIWKSRFGLM